MRLVCSQNQLSANLSLVSRAVATRPTHPVLGNILLRADKELGLLSLTAFDLNLGIQVTFAAEVLRAGEITLPAKLLNDIISRLPDEIVTLSTEEGELVTAIACGSGKYQVNGLSVNEFPELPQISQDSETAYLPVAMLLLGLEATLFAASTDEAKRVLTGVHITADGERLEFAATDGHRLSVVQLALEEPVISVVSGKSQRLEVTVPAKALRELERILGQQKEEAIAVKFDQSQMVFESAGQKLTSRLLDGTYPNYNQLLPKQFARQVTLERKALMGALERIAVLADQKNNIVKLSLNAVGQEVAIAVDAPDVATGRESVLAQISGDDLDVAFNVRYLLDGLKAIASNEVFLQLNTATSPATISPVGGTKITYLIMPVQVKS